MGVKTPPYANYPAWTQAQIKDQHRVHSLVVRNPSNGCWEFMGGTIKGYGQLSVKNKRTYLHRFSYEAFKGPIPDGLLVRHTCDNRRCSNPDHLLVGTIADNARDAVERNPERSGMGFICTCKEVYTFVHKDGSEFEGTPNQLYKKHNLNPANVWRMLKGRRPSAYGWRIKNG